MSGHFLYLQHTGGSPWEPGVDVSSLWKALVFVSHVGAFGYDLLVVPCAM